MKNKNSRSLPLLTLAAVTLAFTGALVSTGQEKQSRPGFPGSNVVNNDADQLKTYSFAQRAEFAVIVRNHVAVLDNLIASLGSAQDTSSVGDPRATAMAELKSARAQLDEQIGKIDGATSGSWESVRDEVLSALAQTRSAYNRAANL